MSGLTREEFEGLLDAAAERLGLEVRQDAEVHAPRKFEQRVFEVLKSVAQGQEIDVSPSFHPHAFPDIIADGYGVEVKSTTKDSWQSVGNSVFEGMRAPSVDRIYVVFGKMGGFPSVRWGRYEEKITHVRISHAPRFVLEMDRDARLFDHLDVTYPEFARLSAEEKMGHIRQYSRARLNPGERLWWLEGNEDETERSLPVEIRIYMDLTQREKRQLRAEAAVLCPQICGGARERTKYYDVSTYLLRAHGVLAPQTRDLFSAGSVGAKHGERGGPYMQRALSDIESEMDVAMNVLDGELFVEYWGVYCAPGDRIREWLSRADSYARDWRPSDHLFLDCGND